MLALLLPVGADWYAIDVVQVREVVADPLLTRVPTAPDIVLGLFNLRGQIVPLFDTGALIDIGSTRSGAWAAVVHTELGAAGLVTTGVPEATELGEPVDTTELAAGVNRYVVDRRLVTLLETDLLLSRAHMVGAGP